MSNDFLIDRTDKRVNIEYGSTGTIVFFMSKTCEKCDFTIISQYSKILYFKTYIFLDADEQFVNDIQQQFPSFQIQKSNLTVLNKELNVEAVPMVYALNKVGQIVGAGIFNTYDSLLRKISPLVEVFGTGRLSHESIS
ncbi:hypothetical protein JCM16418_92 [Paenibacillus pini JCM 16418]|uniref:Thioredoxin-like fold domain-containing protein n=2 Tax=Paenibacillus TaxID=44249 RepID=W7YCI6_9BACL|nr:hypothetical protein JCM16418_92 [Paenibacillus pini JCM 16418]